MAPIDIHPKNQHYNFSVGPGLASRYVSVVSMFWISIASLIVRLMLEVRPVAGASTDNVFASGWFPRWPASRFRSRRRQESRET